MKKIFAFWALATVMTACVDEEPFQGGEEKEKEVVVVNERVYRIGSDGGTINVPVSANGDYTVSLGEGCGEWLSIVQTKAFEDYIIKLSAEKNETYDERRGTVIISTEDESQSVDIVQSQLDEMIVDRKDYEIGNGGGRTESDGGDKCQL